MKEKLIPTDKYAHLVFPAGLNSKDKKTIIAQCEFQGDTKDADILGFAAAYAEAKELAKKNLQLDADKLQDLILHWGELVDPLVKKRGIRSTHDATLTFGRLLAPGNIAQALQGYAEKYSVLFNEQIEDERDNRTSLFFEFQNIHPFEDGNGRVGDLLWRLFSYAIDKKWPYQLPPEYKK